MLTTTLDSDDIDRLELIASRFTSIDNLLSQSSENADMAALLELPVEELTDFVDEISTRAKNVFREADERKRAEEERRREHPTEEEIKSGRKTWNEVTERVDLILASCEDESVRTLETVVQALYMGLRPENREEKDR